MAIFHVELKSFCSKINEFQKNLKQADSVD